MNYVNCYNCGESDYDNYLTENGFNLVKCKTCGLLYVNPREEESEIVKATKLGTHKGITNLHVVGNFENDKIINYLNVIKFYFKPDILSGESWLDIGCGHGEFMSALKEYTSGNLNILGYEPNLAKTSSAISRGFEVVSDFTQVPKEKFSYLSALNVFSHLSNPVSEINKWSMLLKSGGHFLIQTGNTSHLPPYFHPRPLLLPDHLSFANKEILKSILKRNGFGNFKILLLPIREKHKFRLLRFTKDLILFLLKGEKKIYRFTDNYTNLDMYFLSQLKR